MDLLRKYGIRSKSGIQRASAPKEQAKQTDWRIKDLINIEKYLN